MLVPVVVQDARFRAGRALVTTGHSSEATSTFVALLEGCRASYPDDDIECAAAYYEYGNAVFRSLGDVAANDDAAQKEEDEDDVDPKSSSGAETKQQEQDQHWKRKAAADAAEKRYGSPLKPVKSEETSPKEDDKPFPKDADKISLDVKVKADETPSTDVSSQPSETKKVDTAEEEEEDNEQSDMQLALENMETAWSILDQYLSSCSSSSSSSQRYLEWATEQFPRYLTGIGDVLSALGRPADAADAYSRAVQQRHDEWERLVVVARTDSSAQHKLRQLVCRRRIVETYVLMAEQFLACPPAVDIITSETGSLLCKASERLDFARGYYDKAKDELQETVLLMGQMVAANDSTVDIAEEKENICFASTLLMGVGMELAKEDEEQEALASSKEPAKKKKKVT